MQYAIARLLSTSETETCATEAYTGREFGKANAESKIFNTECPRVP